MEHGYFQTCWCNTHSESDDVTAQEFLDHVQSKMKEKLVLDSKQVLVYDTEMYPNGIDHLLLR